MDSLMWKSWILFLLSLEETLTQDQPPSVKNPDDNKYDMIILIITTFGVIALISIVAMIIYFCQRRERNTHKNYGTWKKRIKPVNKSNIEFSNFLNQESSKDTDATTPMVKVTGIGIDNVSSHCQTSED